MRQGTLALLMGPTTPRKMMSWRRAEEPPSSGLPRWGAIVLTGLAGGAISGLAGTLAARRLGRCLRHDWMVLGTILTRDRGIAVRPGAKEITAGVLVHHVGNVAWTALWWSSFARLEHPTRRRVAMVGALPWALASVTTERAAVLPLLRPLVNEQIPYRTAALVQSTSALALPLYLLLRPADRAADRRADRQVAGMALGAAGLIIGATAIARLLDQTGRSRTPRGDATQQATHRRFLQQMTAHHAVAVDLARLAAENGDSERLRAVGRLMWGERIAQLRIMQAWYRDWYGTEVPPLTEPEYLAIPGMTPMSEVERLEGLRGRHFAMAHLPVTIRHLKGAVRLAERVLRDARDRRIKAMAHSILHAQENQIRTLERLLELARPIEEEAVTLRVTERIHGAAGPDVPRRHLLGRILDATRRLPLLGSRSTGSSRVPGSSAEEAASPRAPAVRATPFRPTEAPRRRPLDGPGLTRHVERVARGVVFLGRQASSPPKARDPRG